MRWFYRCPGCGAKYAIEPGRYLCDECASKREPDRPLEGVLECEWEAGAKAEAAAERIPLPVEAEYFPPIPVGDTPLWAPSRLREELGLPFLFVKDDTCEPTGSFKDRASYLVAAFAKKHALREIVLASTGNAASSMPANKVLATVIFGHCPAWVAGFVSAAIIASTMSSADSDMLCASTIVTKDLIPYFKKDISDKNQIRITRWGNVIIGVGAMCIALFKIDIISLNIFSFMLRAAGPIGAFLLGLLWKKSGRAAGLVSILVGSAVGIAWQFLSIKMKVDNPYGLLPIVVGSATSVLSFVIVTFIERAMGREPAPALKIEE